MTAPLTVIVAVADDGTIGDHGRLPWHLPEDLRHFKAATMGHAMIMGRKTWDSIGRALPGRRSIVVTRDRTWSAEGAERAGSLSEAVAMARATDDDPRVIGGAAIYAEALPLATRVLLTEVHSSPGGDVRFPRAALASFREVERRPAASSELEFVVLERAVVEVRA